MHPAHYLPAVLLLTVFSLSCGSDDIVVPTTGTLDITTTTSGAELDENGYTVRIDEEPAQAIGPAATIEDIELSPGNYTLLLEGLADNCSVLGDNPKTVNIAAGEANSVTFDVTCIPTQGQLRG